MKVLGKVMFVPAIATAAVAVAGTGVGLARAASTTNHLGRATPFTAPVTQSRSMFSSVNNGRAVGLAKKGDSLNCTATTTSTPQGKTFYNCTDEATGVVGWIWSGAF